MSGNLLAAAFAIASAFAFALLSLVIRRGQAHANAVSGVLIGLFVSLPPLFVATALLWEPGWWNPVAILYFAGAGLVGSTIGRTLLYMGIHHLGVSRAIPLNAPLPLVISLLAFAFLGERPGPFVWAGTLLVVGGCAGLTVKKGEDKTWNRGFIWMPFVAVLGFAVSNVFRKVGILYLPSPLLGITVTSASGAFFLFLFSRFLPPVYRPRLQWGKSWYFYGACGLLNSLAFFFQYAAVRHGDLSIVAPLSSTTPLFSLPLSWLLLRDLERVTGLVLAGTLLTVLGAALIAWRIL